MISNDSIFDYFYIGVNIYIRFISNFLVRIFTINVLNRNVVMVSITPLFFIILHNWLSSRYEIWIVFPNFSEATLNILNKRPFLIMVKNVKSSGSFLGYFSISFITFKICWFVIFFYPSFSLCFLYLFYWLWPPFFGWQKNWKTGWEVNTSHFNTEIFTPYPLKYH